MAAVRSAAVLAVALLGTASSSAHHSGAIFDSEKTVTLAGAVREFQWTNPHCWIQLVVSGPEGDVEWSVEMGAPLQLYQAGWKPGTLKPGDEIVVTGHPLRDGTPGALFASAARKDGSALGSRP